MILPIEKKWFDMILSGEKKEEYREIKPYYTKRFQNRGLLDNYELPTINKIPIIFRNGYSATSPAFLAICSLDVKTGKEEWGAEPNKKYYVLRIEKIENVIGDKK